MNRVAEAFSTAIFMRRNANETTIDSRAAFDEAFSDLSSDERTSVWSSASSVLPYDGVHAEDATCTCGGRGKGKPLLYEVNAKQALFEAMERDGEKEPRDAQTEEDSK